MTTKRMFCAVFFKVLYFVAHHPKPQISQSGQLPSQIPSQIRPASA